MDEGDDRLFEVMGTASGAGSRVFRDGFQPNRSQYQNSKRILLLGF